MWGQDPAPADQAGRGSQGSMAARSHFTYDGKCLNCCSWGPQETFGKCVLGLRQEPREPGFKICTDNELPHYLEKNREGGEGAKLSPMRKQANNCLMGLPRLLSAALGLCCCSSPWCLLHHGKLLPPGKSRGTFGCSLLEGTLSQKGQYVLRRSFFLRGNSGGRWPFEGSPHSLPLRAPCPAGWRPTRVSRPAKAAKNKRWPEM